MSEEDPDALAALFLEIFEEDRRGAAILEHLQVKFGRVQVHTDGGIDAVLKTFKSGAQAAVVGYILNQIDRAKNMPPINPE